MQDDQVTVFLTGFGPFRGVNDNPTMHLMNEIHLHLKDHPLQNNVHIPSSVVVEVSAVAAHLAISDHIVNNKIYKGREDNQKTVFLHFGVHGGATSFLLEEKGWNEASFSCPDERGWSPLCLPITDHDICHNYRTTLPTSKLSASLCSRGFDCQLSQSAGRFLCNYIYYLSLHYSSQNNTHSLFVHVPPFSVIPQQTQLEFVRALLDEIATSLLGKK
eukprot:TRINITY_DN13559_c0_g1_i1.p1 TRINITY_DN13559_c0_g1~~TRINITY_DN13559_c0_g1_i1.p1  ORF type:complete len:217 (-),score=20.90 TRINITY_DN13559_c0_g1_i1:65-715(-)